MNLRRNVQSPRNFKQKVTRVIIKPGNQFAKKKFE